VQYERPLAPSPLSADTSRKRRQVQFLWIGDADRTVGLNPNATRVHASLWHDGCGKIHATIYVSILTAIRMAVNREPVLGMNLRSFPLIGVELGFLKEGSMRSAQLCLEELFPEMVSY
jgi:hypothetical protein